MVKIRPTGAPKKLKLRSVCRLLRAAPSSPSMPSEP
jgi:hypothetical protein